VEELIGPDTVSTIPPGTLDAFRDHGRPRLSLTENLAEVPKQLAALKELGIDLSTVTHRVKDEGVALFERPFDSLMETLTRKQECIVAGEVGKQSFTLGRYADAIHARQKSWSEANVTRRIWRKDATVWVPDPEKAALTTITRIP
jgi:transaldolase/glucose-6-phosphate isomerase